MRIFNFCKNASFIYKTQGQSHCVNYFHIWRSLNECQFFYVEEGELNIEQNGKRFDLKKGDYLITEKNLDYGGYKESTCLFRWVHFDFVDNDVFFSDCAEEGCFSMPKTGHVEEDGNLLVLLVLMQQYSLNPAKKEVMNSFLGTIIRDLWATVSVHNEPAKKDIRFQPVLDYFHNNPYYNEVHDLKSMAEFFGYSEKYLIRLFKRNTGQSPLQYLTTKKIQRAQEMLAKSDMTVKAIAAALHYDYYYFMRLFRKKTGMTPNQFRKTIVPDFTTFVKCEVKK